MYWFWIHTVFSIVFCVLFVACAYNSYKIYCQKESWSFTTLPLVMKQHVKLGYGFVLSGVLSLISGYMVRRWGGWYADVHRDVPLFLILALIAGAYSGYSLMKNSGSRPLFHAFVMSMAFVLTIVQFASGAVMLGIVWSG